MGTARTTLRERIRAYQAGSDFFQPPAYARCRSRSCVPGWADAPRQMLGHR
ncbi:hypothetical protein [Streptomyces atratus]|uniref:hypothetical protein n=1 Tax=Streptomyces atratus TaxID=1893 RepID=UPI0033CAD490